VCVCFGSSLFFSFCSFFNFALFNCLLVVSLCSSSSLGACLLLLFILFLHFSPVYLRLVVDRSFHVAPFTYLVFPARFFCQFCSRMSTVSRFCFATSLSCLLLLCSLLIFDYAFLPACFVPFFIFAIMVCPFKSSLQYQEHEEQMRLDNDKLEQHSGQKGRQQHQHQQQHQYQHQQQQQRQQMLEQQTQQEPQPHQQRQLLEQQTQPQPSAWGDLGPFRYASVSTFAL
jgi:hypothetical protein